MRTRANDVLAMRGEVNSGESGQASVLLIVILGTFLLASVGFAVDMGSMWFSRQAAQTSADAACVAGAMDMLYIHNGKITTSPGFTVGTAGDCYTSSNVASICKYAGFNGFVASTSAGTWSSSTAAGAVAVNWTFPTSVTGATASPGITYPYLNVVVRQQAPTWFIGVIGINSMTVGASCTCGLPPGVGAPPLVILNPTVASALSFTGGTNIVIIGGPPASIGVNSSSTTAITCTGGATSDNTIDTSAAGPSGTGGILSLVGGPTRNPTCGALTILKDPNNVLWKSGQGATPNPYAGVPAPTKPGAPASTTGSTYLGDSSCNQLGLTSANCGRKDPTYGYITGIWVGAGVDTCPNNTTATGSRHYIGQDSGSPYTQFYGNCLEFSPGYYPTGINLSSLAQETADVATFQPGVYYLNGSLTVASSNTVRNVWASTQPSTQGVMFYFLSGGPTFAGSSGTKANLDAVPTYYLNCSGTAIPSGMPTTMPGSVLAAQCTEAGTYVGAPSSDSYSATGFRGLLFYTAASDTYQSALFGAGSILDFSGALYFHNSSYTDQVTLNGAGASKTYSLGNIVVDELIMSGGGTINMGLYGPSLPGAPTVGILQ